MASIFLSYRRTDGAEACRVREWLARRLGEDAVFMDVENIPFAVSFPEYIKKQILSSNVMLALIGANWAERMSRPDDQVLPELEVALINNVPVLPILIGNTPMPNPDQLPQSISCIARQNAVTVGILNDFDTHMRMLLPKIEAILGSLATGRAVTSNPEIIDRSCDGIMRFLDDTYVPFSSLLAPPQWNVASSRDFANVSDWSDQRVTLFLHRVTRLSDLLELHFILSFLLWPGAAERLAAGWVIRQLEEAPLIPSRYFAPESNRRELVLKIRRSDEDPRVIWKMITDQPLRLSLAYIATISPKE